MTKNKNSLILFLIPLVFILVAAAFATKMYPIYTNTPFYGQDPAYQYLFAGVDILQGNAPAHNDHPGTPLQLLIAIIVAVTWFFRYLFGLSGQETFLNVLLHPEVYLASVSAVVVCLNAVSVYFIGRQVFKVSQSHLLAAICQMTPLTFALVSPSIVYPAPESLLWCLSLLLFAVLTPILLGDGLENNISKRKIAVIAGAVCGFGLAVKVTFLPLVGLLLILRSWRLILLSGLSLIGTWFLGVLPIYSRLGRFFDWLLKILNHSGLHGEGQKSLLNIKEFMSNLNYVRHMFSELDAVVWALFIVCILGSLKYVTVSISDLQHGKRPKNSDQKKSDIYCLSTAFVLFFVVLVQAAMVAKHPGPTYMIPVLPIVTISIVWLVQTQQFVLIPLTLRPKLTALLFVFFVYQTVSSSISAYSALSGYRSQGEISNSAVQNEINKYNNPVLIGTFNCTLPLCALWFGQLMTPAMDLKMDKVNDDFYHFDIFSKTLFVPGKGPLSDSDAAKTLNELKQLGRPVLLISPVYDQLAKFELEKIIGNSVQNLYRVIGLKTGS